MNNKLTAVLAVVIVILVAGVGVLYFSGMLNFNTTTTTTGDSLQSTPSERAPNIVTSSVVSKSLGGHWDMTVGASGSTLNASSFIGGQSSVPLVEQSQVNPQILTGGLVASPFVNFGVGNNASYNSYQMAIFVPPQNGYALISFAHSNNSGTPGFIVNTIRTELMDHFQGKTSYNSSEYTFDTGFVSSSEYVFLAMVYNAFPQEYAKGTWYLEGVLANYSSYNIMFLYYTPHFLNVTNFTTLLSNQVEQLKSPSTPAQPSVLISSKQLGSVSGIDFNTQGAMAINLNNTQKLLNEYINMTGSSRQISSSNRTILNNTLGKLSGIEAKYMNAGDQNTSEIAMLGFTSSGPVSAIYDLITANSGQSSTVTGNYSGWNFIFSNTTLDNYNYIYNSTNDTYQTIKIPYANQTTFVAFQGKYMLIFEITQKYGVFTENLAKELMQDESNLI
ncbi:hypothetical protein ACNF40_03585 [Cuniculiplasma sp. SKW4]|uniref:hypothetical protein n=1 Tax=Cuniculiplasma sp. SKW4 TaxID=3400171 RepID=UPI003FD61FCB